MGLGQSLTTTKNPLINLETNTNCQNQSEILETNTNEAVEITKSDSSDSSDSSISSMENKINKAQILPEEKKILDFLKKITETDESDDENQDDKIPADCETIKQILSANTKINLWDNQLKMISRCIEIENKSEYQTDKLVKLIDKYQLNPNDNADQEKIKNNKFMMELHKHISENFGVMADKPGSGKTYAILSLIMVNLYQKPNLIVVPQNIFSQWDNEINNFCNMKFIRYKKVIEYSDTIDIFTCPESLLSYDIILVTPLHYYMLASALIRTRKTIARVFFDEIDTIEHILKEPLCARFTWFISASFRNNKIGLYRLTSNQILKNTCNIGEVVELTNPEIQLIESKENIISCLKDIVSDKKIGELNGLDFRIDNNFFEFNKKTCSDYLEFTKLVVTELNDKHRNYLERINELKSSISKVGEFGGHGNDYKKEIKIETITKEINYYNGKLAETVSAIRKINNSFGLENNGQSGISMENLEKKLIPSDKFEKIKEIITKKYSESNKIIIFSDYSTGINKIINWLELNNYSYTNFEGGNHVEISKSLDKYKNSITPILIVNSFMYACGMNLEFTTDVLILHYLDPLIESQVIGRAQRFGRKSKLNIYKFLNSNEIK